MSAYLQDFHTGPEHMVYCHFAVEFKGVGNIDAGGQTLVSPVTASTA